MTQQIKDILIYDEREILLNEEILEEYFREHPEKRPNSEVFCTALWRGYVATFEILDKALILKKMERIKNAKFQMELIPQNLFLDNTFDWFSGLIRIDDYRGFYDAEPEDGLFEFLEIRNGILAKNRKMTFDKLQLFKKEQFDYFINSDEVQIVYQRLKHRNPNYTFDQMNTLIFNNILYYTKEVYVDE